MKNLPDTESTDWRNPFVRVGSYTPAFVAGREGVYPSMFFRYKRMAPKEIEKKHKEFKDALSDPSKVIDFTAKLIVEQLTEWSFRVPVTRENIQSLNHPLMLRVYWIIMQTDPTDEIPEEFLIEGEKANSEEEQKKS
jgi:hypothetical protein